MRTHRSYWHVLIGMLGLMIILAACGGGSTNSTTGTNGAGTPPATSATSTTPAGSSGNSTGTISFTASGGLSGSYTFKVPITNDTNTISTPISNEKQFAISATDNGKFFEIRVLPYTGPGSYTLSNQSVPDNSQQKTVLFVVGQKSWGGSERPSPIWTCPLNIASDTAATFVVLGTSITSREIKGSFSCSKVLPQANFYPSIDLNNGQFDVFAQS